MAKAFTRGGYSFRPEQQGYPHARRTVWHVRPKGSRIYYLRATITEGTGPACIVNLSGIAEHDDARPSFKEACDLVMARLPREGA